jgi:uncharacterized protein (DUF1684 family)
MNLLKISALIFLSIVLVQASYCQKSPSETADNYVQTLLKDRADKNEELITDEKSPLTEEDKKDFKGLHYYPPDEKYRVVATLERFDNPFHFKMKTTTERLPEYATYGRISFQIKDTTYQLFVYQNIELMKKPGYEKYLFIPFNDNTNAETTYGGGRFMDTYIPEGDTLILDFNKAYNPYCAYNSKYSCPIPPEENFLDTRIEAGELKWHD